ncbi:IS3 family transposase [Diaphorobacter aerolatus]|uniref:IS3 family transposase n=1 Tax=Diaphorobacter aerolatus TaxID=1288495 RepID=A0A7H0GJW1_9BURK|nr:IS3 family transposase [Diaphorobacter aerolatus]QNP48577.1 IS3 family transposase [Diaphorobacter aerolatus]
MYSHEDRLRAVRLYVKLGRRIGLTIRQLGYPTKNALKTWYREYEQSHELRAGYTRPARFSKEQKERAVEHYLEHGQCIAATIKSLGYPCRSLLSTWLQELHPQRTRVVGRSQELAPEAKQAAVVSLCTRAVSAQAVADEVGVSRGSLYKWKNQLLGHDVPASMKRKQGAPASSDRADLEQQLETLRQDIRRLQLEKDLLKKANELVKKELGINQQHLTNREKTLLVDALRSTYTVTELLRELNLPRSSYFYHRARLEVADKYAGVRQVMTNIFERNYRCYGYRRLHASLSDQFVNISEKVVRRLMKQECLVAATSRRRRYGSYMGEISPAPDNVLDRDFSAGAPNEKWLTDITEFQIPAGKVYLSPMIDCFDGMVVSWSISTRPNAELVNTMLDAAIDKVAASGERPVVHSDRGGHYRWPGWLARIAAAKLVRSMSRKGCSPDNAACEGFFGRLKTEMFFARDWLSTSIEEFVVAVDTYIRWYNEVRIKSSLGFRSPAEHRRRLGIAA